MNLKTTQAEEDAMRKQVNYDTSDNNKSNSIRQRIPTVTTIVREEEEEPSIITDVILEASIQRTNK